MTLIQTQAPNFLFPSLSPLLSAHLYINFPLTQRYESELLMLQMLQLFSTPPVSFTRVIVPMPEFCLMCCRKPVNTPISPLQHKSDMLAGVAVGAGRVSSNISLSFF